MRESESRFDSIRSTYSKQRSIKQIHVFYKLDFIYEYIYIGSDLVILHTISILSSLKHNIYTHNFH